VRGLRLEWHGLRVSLDELEARYDLSGLPFSRTARVDRLGARGLVVDLRSVERPAAEPTDPPAEPFRFEGLRPFARLPVRVVLSEVRADAEILATAPDGGTVRLDVVLSGRGVEPGATGDLDAEIGLRLEHAGATREILTGTGSLSVHQSDEGVLDVLEFRGRVRPADPTALHGAGMAARVSADLTAADEAYGLVLSTTGEVERDVVDVSAARRDSNGGIAGSWKARLDAGQANPYLGDLAPPEFALSGTGTFEIDPLRGTATTRSRFEVSASQWERLHPELAAIGALRFDADLEADYAPPRIAVRTLSARVAPAGAEPVLEIGADQPFRVDLDARTIEPSRWGAPLAHLKLDGVPLTWWTGSGSGVGPVAGSVRGSLALTLDDASRMRLRSAAPMEAAGVRLRTSGRRDLGPIAARADIDAELTPEKVTAALGGCRVSFADTSKLAFDGSFAMLRDGRLTATLEGDLAAHAAALAKIVPEIDAVGARGHFRLDLSAGTLSVVDAAVSVSDGGGRKMVEGTVSSVRPLVVDLNRLAPRWNEFEPESLRLRVEGFPVAWVSRFLPEIRIESGTLHGSLRATVPPDRSVRIAGDVPFELRDADLFWGDLPVLRKARLDVSPSIVLSASTIEADLNPITYADSQGNRFDGAVRVRSVPARGRDASFAVDLRASAPSLTSRIGNLGDFEVHAAGSFDDAADALRLAAASFDCKDAEGRSYLRGTSVQPFVVGLAPLAITPTEESPDLFRATFAPLELEKLFPEAFGFAFAGPLPSGEAVISASGGGLLFHAPRPLEFGPISVTRNGSPFLDKVRFTILPEVAYTTTGVRSRETLVEISSGGKKLVSIVSRGVFDVIGLEPQRRIETTVEAALPALVDQPVAQGLPRFDRGALTLSSSVTAGATREVDLRLALSGLVRGDGIVAPDLDARAHATREAGGPLRIEAPIRLTAPGRTSDLTARGRLNLSESGNAIELSIDSDRIVVEDVARLTSVLLPPGEEDSPAEKPPADSSAASAQTLLTRFGPKDGKPIWNVLHGRVPIALRSVEFDRYAVRNVHATIESTPSKLAVEDIGATFLGARMGGCAAVTFENAGVPLYSVETALQVADVDLGRMFTQVDPSRKPTLEGRFRLDMTTRGSGPDPVVALLESRAEILAEGADGMFRGLVPGAKTASRLVRAAGALTFSKEMRATGRLIARLQDLEVHEARVRLERDPSRGLILDSLDVRSEGLVVHGTGSVRRERERPLLGRELRLEVDLAASGDAAIVFDGLGLLGEQPSGEGGFRPVTRTIAVGGTVVAPDASDLWKALDDAAADAKGSFGWALRKVLDSGEE
jgi:hypothetical protein